MTPSEHKEFVQAAWRTATPDLITNYLVRLVSEEATIDDLRKAIELANRVTGADADKKVDLNASLAVFNITFADGGVVASPVAQIGPAVADDILDVIPRPARKKKPALAAKDSAPDLPEMNMEDMMAGLDDMLGSEA